MGPKSALYYDVQFNEITFLVDRGPIYARMYRNVNGYDIMCYINRDYLTFIGYL